MILFPEFLSRFLLWIIWITVRVLIYFYVWLEPILALFLWRDYLIGVLSFVFLAFFIGAIAYFFVFQFNVLHERTLRCIDFVTFAEWTFKRFFYHFIRPTETSWFSSLDRLDYYSIHALIFLNTLLQKYIKLYLCNLNPFHHLLKNFQDLLILCLNTKCSIV